MQIDLTLLSYSFLDQPLLIGGKAMEFYNLRKAGADVDFVVSARDHVALVKKYPDDVQDLFGDMGVCVGEFEIWNKVLLFDYEFLQEHCLAQENFCVIALDKLLFLKTLAPDEPKTRHDIQRIVEKIKAIQYGKDTQFSGNFFQRSTSG